MAQQLIYKTSTPYVDGGVNKIHTMTVRAEVTWEDAFRAEFKVLEVLENVNPPSWGGDVTGGGYSKAPAALKFMQARGTLTFI